MIVRDFKNVYTEQEKRNTYFQSLSDRFFSCCLSNLLFLLSNIIFLLGQHIKRKNKNTSIPNKEIYALISLRYLISIVYDLI